MGPLGQRIAELSHTLPPEPTGVEPRLPEIDGVRAVVFDVYGTLLVSGCGDISLASEDAREEAAQAALATVVPGASAGPLVERLLAAIRRAHADSPSETPEVEIREVWRSALGERSASLDDATIERLALDYECRVNPVWPMPGLSETLTGLAGAGMRLGIVSNAQFFTPLAFEPLTGRSLENWGFDPGLCVWSYEHREAKPGVFLYERCVEALSERGIDPAEALFVGNDLRNDVWPAQRVGMRGVLFAGDARSLRLREEDPRLTDVRPDAVVTDLRQLLEITAGE